MQKLSLDDRGVTTSQYAILLALISAVTVVAVLSTGDAISNALRFDITSATSAGAVAGDDGDATRGGSSASRPADPASTPSSPAAASGTGAGEPDEGSAGNGESRVADSGRGIAGGGGDTGGPGASGSSGRSGPNGRGNGTGGRR